MNIFDDEFMVSNYINNSNSNAIPKELLISQKAKDEAIAWSTDAIRTIIIPTNDLFDLEDQWIRFNQMTRKQCRESDWKSIELFGMTNKDHYEIIRAKLLAKDIDNDIDKELYLQIANDKSVNESYIDDFGAEEYYETDELNYTTEDVEKARKWAKESNRVIILPTRTLAELESLWDAFNMMHHKHKRESDWSSQEYFGITNLRHYEYLKNQFLKENINSNDIPDKYGVSIEHVSVSNVKKYLTELSSSVTANQFAKTLLEMALPSKGVYEEVITNNIISGAIDTFSGLSEILPEDIIYHGDMPYFTPDEMISMGINSEIPTDNFYGVSADNILINEDISVSEWFNMYRAIYDGFYTEFADLASSWVNKVRYLMHGLPKLIESGDINKINARKQSILELGWNPDIEFTDKARLIARESCIHNMVKNNTVTRMVDLRGFRTTVNENATLNNNGKENLLHPIYIILSEGKSLFSSSIKGITKSIYSHVSLSFDSVLDKMYSFGVEDNDRKRGKMRGGFRVEDIKNIPSGSRIGVYTFFLKTPEYEKIKAMVEDFKNNINKTAYGYTNIITYLFNIPYNRDWKLICSQFVDRCLKFAGIDITKKDSSLVSPAYFDKVAREEKRIYNVYEGLASKYDGLKIKKLINSLTTKAIPLKEQNHLYYRNETSYITGLITNIDNISIIMEMRNHIDLVHNPLNRKILEEVLFNRLEVQAYCEAKEFPVQFDKEGNLIIKNLKKLNFDSEFAKSHKLLKEYNKSNNLDGIKYELSKLWMMNCIIEEKINPSNGKESSATDKDYSSRANILNDFKYYMGIVMKSEPSFNFTEYYDNSPFSSASTKINRPTLTFMGKMIKNFVKSLV